jgi:excisionase family DNA binding protein
MEKLWTTSETAQFLGIHELDVEELVRQGVLTGYRLGGQFLRFRPDEVAALKGRLPPVSRHEDSHRQSWLEHLKEFVYFYDFYVVSVTCLAALIIYLLAAV